MREPEQAPERDQIRTVIENLHRARGAKDSAAALAHYAPGGVHYSLAPPLRSAAPNAKELEAWFATWRGEIGLEAHDLEITAVGDLACCTGLNHMTGTKTDGERVDLWYRATVCLRSTGGRWRIAHEHESVPFYMDGSYRAAVDLKP